MNKYLATLLSLFLLCIFQIDNVKRYSEFGVCEVYLRLPNYDPWMQGDACSSMFMFGVSRGFLPEDDCKKLKVGGTLSIITGYEMSK